MRTQPGATELQLQGVRAVIEAVAAAIPLDELLVTDACAAVVGAMTGQHAGSQGPDSLLQKAACSAIAALATLDASRRDKLASCGVRCFR